LTELLTNLPDRSTEELKNDLRAEGINPERIVNRVKRLIKTGILLNPLTPALGYGVKERMKICFPGVAQRK
jgi:DNA-binding Lrp family transcriptional regulator